MTYRARIGKHAANHLPGGSDPVIGDWIIFDINNVGGTLGITTSAFISFTIGTNWDATVEGTWSLTAASNVSIDSSSGNVHITASGDITLDTGGQVKVNGVAI